MRPVGWHGLLAGLGLLCMGCGARGESVDVKANDAAGGGSAAGGRSGQGGCAGGSGCVGGGGDAGTGGARPGGSGGVPTGGRAGSGGVTGGSGGAAGSSGGAGASGGGAGGMSGASGASGIGGGSGSGGRPTEPTVQVVTAARRRYDATVLPTEALTVSSPFGPRLQASQGHRYDFHRGIDIAGQDGAPIYALADGTVYEVALEGEVGSKYPSGGTVVVLRHQLDEAFPFHGRSFTAYYSLYMHLSAASVAEGAVVSAGERIGSMGKTGETDFVHLHLETRIGTNCSLAYQREHPTSTCATFGFDPHVNPFLFLPYGSTEPLAAASAVGQYGVSVGVETPRTQLDFNRVVVNGLVVDLDTRQGIDLIDMDNASFEGVTIAPAAFSVDTPTYGIGFAVDGASLPPSSEPPHRLVVEVYDVWGGGTITRYP